MTEHLRSLLSMWDNGGRWLLIVGVYFFLAVGTLIIVLLGAWLWPSDARYEPLGGYILPQTVSTPVVRVGTSVTVTGTKCNLSDEAITVTGARHWRRIEPSNLIVADISGSGVREPGCLTRTFENIPPSGVTPGRWIVEGVDETARGDRRQVIGWYTESFLVEGGESGPEG